MPPKPSWFRRIPEIRATLERLEEPLLDRAAIERLFRVSPRRAMRLAHQMGARQIGHALVLERGSALAFLSEQGLEKARRAEVVRRRHLAEAIAAAQSEAAARRVRIGPRTLGDGVSVQDLPPTVKLAPGELRVAFTEPHDLLRQLYLLSRAIAHDFASFETALTRGAAQSPLVAEQRRANPMLKEREEADKRI